MFDKLQHFISVVFRDIPTSFLVGFLVLFAVGTILFLAIMGGKQGAKWSAGLFLVEYMALLFALAVLTRKVHPDRAFDFSLFWSYRAAIQSGKDALLIQNIANVLAFIPIGILLGCIFGWKKWWKVVLIGGGFSVLIEVLQFAFRLGFAEFDDVFHNVVGCTIGYGVYVGIALGSGRLRASELTAKWGLRKSVNLNPN